MRFYLFNFCIATANSMIGMYLSHYLAIRGITEERIGELLSIYHLSLPLVVLVFGFLSDRIRCRPMILLGSLFSIAYCALMPRLSDVRLMACAIALGGIGVTLSMTAANVLFLKSLGSASKGRNLSRFVAANLVGYCLGTATSAILVLEPPYRSAAIFHAALPLQVVCFIVALGLPHAPMERFPIVQYFKDMVRLPVFCLALITFTVGIHFGTENFALVRFMDEHLHMRGLEIAVYFLIVGVAMPLSSRWGGHLFDARGRIVSMVVLSMLVSGLSLATVSIADGFWPYLVIRLFHTGADGMLIFGIQMYVSMVFVSGRVGGNYGFNRTLSSLGASLGAAVTGFLVGASGLATPFWAAGATQAGMAGMLWVLVRHRVQPAMDRQ